MGEIMPPILIHTQGLTWFPDPPLDESRPHPLGSRFYIKLYPPASSPDKNVSKHWLPYAGVSKGVLRLNLCPSTHAGVNGSYRVEYWESRPMYPLSKGLYVKDKLVREEYWHIPYGNCHTCRIDMLRSDLCSNRDNTDPIPLPEALEVIQIVNLYSPQEGIEWKYYTLEELYPSGLVRLGNAPPVEGYGISWGTIKPRTGTEYYVEYLKPYYLCDVLNSPNNFAYQGWLGAR